MEPISPYAALEGTAWIIAAFVVLGAIGAVIVLLEAIYDLVYRLVKGKPRHKPTPEERAAKEEREKMWRHCQWCRSSFSFDPPDDDRYGWFPCSRAGCCRSN